MAHYQTADVKADLGLHWSQMFSGPFLIEGVYIGNIFLAYGDVCLSNKKIFILDSFSLRRNFIRSFLNFKMFP